MNKKLVMLMVGSSGSGKNTVIKALIKNNNKIKFIVSHTTRAIREGEKDGEQYHYVTVKEFEKLLEDNQILESDYTHNKYYGISKKEIYDKLKTHDILLKDLTMPGVENCKKYLDKNISVCSVFLTNKKSVLKRRLKLRGEKQIALRLKVFKKEQWLMNSCDYIIFNHSLEQTTQICEAIIKSYISDIALLPSKGIKVNNKKIEKYTRQLNNNKILKPVKVALYSGKIYILNGVEKYLAGLKTNRLIARRFVNTQKVFLAPSIQQLNEWKKILKKFLPQKIE